MIIVPFKSGIFTVTDQQELSEEDQLEVSLALRDGLNLMPQEYHCEAVRPVFVDSIPIIRFGIYIDRDLVGALWLGCTDLAPDSTARNAKVFVRPAPGIIIEQTERFWKAGVFVQILKYLLNNPLRTRAGGTVQVIGLDYAKDAKVVLREFAEIHRGLDELFEIDSGVVTEKSDLSQGGQDIRIRKAPERPTDRIKRL